MKKRLRLVRLSWTHTSSITVKLFADEEAIETSAPINYRLSMRLCETVR